MLGGGGGTAKRGLFTPGKRRRMNIVAICLNIFVPWILFICVFATLSFDFHYKHPGWAWFLVGIAVLMVLLVGFTAIQSKRRERDPMWYTFATVAMAVAVLIAVILGDINYRSNLAPYYDINNLQVYEDVKPELDKGQALMDAGKVYFTAGSQIDTTRSVGFKNGDLYCVAPIIKAGAAMTTYDFWAVGKNCCADRADFRCGEYANARARNGLRLMHDEDRPFYRLAVQEAEAVYGISSPHPLFFYWMQDPLGEQKAYRDDGYKYFLLGVFSHFAFNLFCVLCATIGFSKLGRTY